MHSRRQRVLLKFNMAPRQAAPYDFLAADEALSGAELARARGEAAAWLAEGAYALLPYSSLVLESVSEAAAQPPRQAMMPAAAASPGRPAASGRASAAQPLLAPDSSACAEPCPCRLC